jgi:hypothetical protein
MNKKEYFKMSLGGVSIFLLLTQIPIMLYLLLLYPLLNDLSSSGMTWMDIFNQAFVDQNLIPFALMLIASIVFFILIKSENKANNDKIMGGAYLFGGAFSAVFLIGYTPSSFSLYSTIVGIIKNYATAAAAGTYSFGDIMQGLKMDLILTGLLIVALALAVILVLMGLSKLTSSESNDEYKNAFEDESDSSDWIADASDETAEDVSETTVEDEEKTVEENTEKTDEQQQS